MSSLLIVGGSGVYGEVMPVFPTPFDVFFSPHLPELKELVFKAFFFFLRGNCSIHSCSFGASSKDLTSESSYVAILTQNLSLPLLGAVRVSGRRRQHLSSWLSADTLESWGPWNSPEMAHREAYKPCRY